MFRLLTGSRHGLRDIADADLEFAVSGWAGTVAARGFLVAAITVLTFPNLPRNLSSNLGFQDCSRRLRSDVRASGVEFDAKLGFATNEFDQLCAKPVCNLEPVVLVKPAVCVLVVHHSVQAERVALRSSCLGGQRGVIIIYII